MTAHSIMKGHIFYLEMLGKGLINTNYRGGGPIQKGKKRKPGKNDLVYNRLKIPPHKL